jgi:hypothetical protein
VTVVTNRTDSQQQQLQHLQRFVFDWRIMPLDYYSAYSNLGGGSPLAKFAAPSAEPSAERSPVLPNNRHFSPIFRQNRIPNLKNPTNFPNHFAIS